MHCLYISITIVLVFRPCLCFLLDTPPNTGQNTLHGQYVTQSEFQDKNNVLHRETENLRHDMDKTFEILTAQLKLRLDTIENHVLNQAYINATKLDEIERKYKELSVKYEKLQSENGVCSQTLYNMSLNTKAELNSIKQHASNQSVVIRDLQQKAADYEKNQSEVIRDLQQHVADNEKNQTLAIRDLQQHAADYKQNQSVVIRDLIQHARNYEANQSAVIRDLQQHVANYEKNQSMAIRDLQLHAADYEKNQSVVIRDLQLHAADYEKNQSVVIRDLQQHVADYEKNQSVVIRDLQQHVAAYEKNQYVVIRDLQQHVAAYEKNQSMAMQDIHQMVTDLENDTRKSIESIVSLLSNRIDENAEQVALFAYPTNSDSDPIKFSHVVFSVGIRNLTSLKSEGVFTCEIPGLYLVSVSISTHSDYSELNVYKNGDNNTRGRQQLLCNRNGYFGGDFNARGYPEGLL